MIVSLSKRAKGIVFAAGVTLSAQIVSSSAQQRPAFRMDFVSIPAGEFTMGCSDGDTACVDREKPAHRVRITKPFQIGKYEVTQTQWEAIMGSNPSHFRGANLPVDEVTVYDAQEFLRRLNAKKDGYKYRLPTEAEWEYAARAGSTSPYYGSLDDIAWHVGNSGGQTHPVGQKKPNAWGLYDIHGNLWEWVEDWYDENYYKSSPPADPTGPAKPTDSGYVRRGGGWNTAAGPTRVSNRNLGAPDYHVLGMRIVREKQ